MSDQLNKVTICLMMTSLLVLMPHSGFLANYGEERIEIESTNTKFNTSNSETVWVDGDQPWPQPGRTQAEHQVEILLPQIIVQMVVLELILQKMLVS